MYLLIDKQDSAFKFSDYLSKISNGNLKPILKTCFDNPVETEGRISITDFVSLLVNDRIHIKDFKTRTGIDKSEEITLVELSVVVLHDLLTQRLIAE